MGVKLADWARETGIDYKTAYRWFRTGILPIPSKQMPTGTILVFPQASSDPTNVVLYARVSSHDQKADLDRQLARLVEYATQNGLVVKGATTEIGSGLNGHRPKLLRLLKDPNVGGIVVEHRDRLMRFGAEYVESTLAAQGRRLIVVDRTEMKDDLVQDMADVLTSFCTRLYGRRAAKNRARKALEAATHDG
jgi:predicted site-specific integrase-resolvase